MRVNGVAVSVLKELACVPYPSLDAAQWRAAAMEYLFRYVGDELYKETRAAAQVSTSTTLSRV